MYNIVQKNIYRFTIYIKLLYILLYIIYKKYMHYIYIILLYKCKIIGCMCGISLTVFYSGLQEIHELTALYK